LWLASAPLAKVLIQEGGVSEALKAMVRDDYKTRTYLALESGTMVSHYRIIEIVGDGGIGKVSTRDD
jgi:uncharacterized protein (UPF0248 family)